MKELTTVENRCSRFLDTLLLFFPFCSCLYSFNHKMKLIGSQYKLCVLFQKSVQELVIYRVRAGVQGIEEMLYSGN